MVFLLLFLLLFIGLFSLTMYWIFKNRLRTTIFLAAVGSLILFGIIFEVFFVDHSMQFVRSKAYPSMFLIKNIDVTDDALKKIIKNKITEEVNKDFIPNRKKYLDYYQDSTKIEYSYHLDFYKYTDDCFLTSGTSYFLDYEEDDGGPTSIHFLSNIEDDKIADYWFRVCDNDPEKYYGVIQWHNKYDKNDNDTIKITCKSVK